MLNEINLTLKYFPHTHVLCKVCGISVEMDGSEDSLVHCITPGSMAADAATAILVETAILLHDINKYGMDTDPFTSDEEFEGDETIVDDE